MKWTCSCKSSGSWPGGGCAITSDHFQGDNMCGMPCQAHPAHYGISGASPPPHHPLYLPTQVRLRSESQLGDRCWCRAAGSRRDHHPDEQAPPAVQPCVSGDPRAGGSVLPHQAHMGNFRRVHPSAFRSHPSRPSHAPCTAPCTLRLAHALLTQSNTTRGAQVDSVPPCG